MKRTFTNTG